MASLTSANKAALSAIESSMARQGFDLGEILDGLEAKEVTSAATTGGAASETVAAVGLADADSIVAVSQRVPGANNLPLLGWQKTGNDDEIQLDYSANPGAGAIVEILYKKA